MDTNEAKFEQAEQCLTSAQAELNRPAEDVVRMMSHKSVQKYIAHYLIGFLLKNNVAFDESDTVKVLLKKCKTTDIKFNNFDLSKITFTKNNRFGTNLIIRKTVLNWPTTLRS